MEITGKELYALYVEVNRLSTEIDGIRYDAGVQVDLTRPDGVMESDFAVMDMLIDHLRAKGIVE